MLIRDNDNGAYTASWTPAFPGVYHVRVRLDDFDAGVCAGLCVINDDVVGWCNSVRDNYNLKSHKYECITTYQPDTKSILTLILTLTLLRNSMH